MVTVVENFNSILGRGRGLGLPPRQRRLIENELDGWLQFIDEEGTITEERRLQAQGAAPVRYRIAARVQLSTEQMQALRAWPREPCPGLAGIELNEGTVAPAVLLRAADDISEYSSSERRVYENYQYFEVIEVAASDQETLLVMASEAGDVLMFGWPSPSPQEDERPWVDLAAFAGRFEHGYTDDDVDSVLPPLSELLGLELVCLWENYKNGMFGGHGGYSEFFVETEAGLVAVPARLYGVLSEPDTDFTRVNAATVGTVIEHPQGSYHQHSGSNYLPGDFDEHEEPED